MDIITIDRDAAADHMEAETARHYGPGELTIEQTTRGSAEYEERLDQFITTYYTDGSN